jgi:murein L,D-transpeptidase YcbB/YkuD
MLPNPLFIYLHDTPAAYLFEAKDRAVSHGCIRVEQPKDLANYALAGNPNWTEDKLEQYTKLKEPKRVNLHTKLPIAITYHTAWVDEQNRLQMRPDIYGMDQKQTQAIQLKEQITSQNSQAYERTIPQSNQ